MVAYCPNCKFTFETNLIRSKNSTHTTFTNIYEACPNCEYPYAKWLDGTYNFDSNGFATLVSGPEFTIRTLKKLLELAEEAKKRDYTAAQFKEEAEKINPQISRFLPQNFADVTGFLALVIAIISLIVQLKSDGASTTITNNYNNTTINNIYNKSNIIDTVSNIYKRRNKK